MDGIPAIEFAPARGGRIAFQRWGSGDEHVVAIPPAAQNIEGAWEWPDLRRMFERFGTFCRYLHFDKRGTGASDRTVRVPHLDVRVDDLRAVMDAAGIERAHLFAQSEGGPTTLLFAAAYPHRVASIVLVGSGARLYTELTDGERREQIALRTAFAEVWGTPDSMAVPLFAPSKVGDAEFTAWHTRYERTAASSDSVRELLIEMLDMDATEVVPTIEVPILVMHRRDDAAMPIRLGREVAELAPDATMIEFDGVDHFCFLGDQDWLDEFERWVTGTVRPQRDDTGPAEVRIETLGRFAVEVRDREVAVADWGSRRARTLLKRLVVARGWPVTRDELSELLWPDDPEPQRLGARLSVQLSHVRRVLGGGVIADRETIALDLDAVEVDIEEVLASDVGDDRILDLVQGDFLPEERYEDWAAPVRDQVRAVFLGAARRRLERLAVADSAGDSSDTHRAERVELAHRLVAADEWDESAHDELVAALAAAGDAAGADEARARRDRVAAELSR